MGVTLGTSAVRVTRGRNPRRNFPSKLARKRGESNLLRAFERVYFAEMRSSGVARTDFDLAGYGIADLVWLSWQSPTDPDEMTAVGLTRRPKVQVTAFELKLSDWRKALQQAFRYSYFANRSVVVLPPVVAERARHRLADFRRLGVGLWSFDATAGKIKRHLTPRAGRPRSVAAREKAITSLLRLAQLR